MQENTQINLKADTPIGPIILTGTIHRTQHETTELKLNVPQIVRQIATSGFGMMTGGVGIAGLAYGLITSVKARKRKEDMLIIHEQEKSNRDETLSQLSKERDVYLREICKGIAKWMNKAPDDEAAALRQSMKESMSRDTRDAVRDYI